jgi:hypothetical protein
MTRRDRGHRERKRETEGGKRERGNYSGDIDPAATRQPLSLDSLNSLDSTPTHLHAYTRFTSSPPPPPPSPSSVSPPRHPDHLLFDLLLLFLFFVFLSTSWSPSLPPLLPRRARAVHPSSLLDRRTRKHQHRRENRTSHPPRESSPRRAGRSGTSSTVIAWSQ